MAYRSVPWIDLGFGTWSFIGIWSFSGLMERRSTIAEHRINAKCYTLAPPDSGGKS
jgi:hypothetical protein